MTKPKYIFFAAVCTIVLLFIGWQYGKSWHGPTSRSHQSHVGTQPHQPESANLTPETSKLGDIGDTSLKPKLNVGLGNASDSSAVSTRTLSDRVTFRETSGNLADAVRSAITYGQLHDVSFLAHVAGACLLSDVLTSDIQTKDLERYSKKNYDAFVELKLRCSQDFTRDAVNKAITDYQRQYGFKIHDLSSWPATKRQSIFQQPDRYASAILNGGAIFSDEVLKAAGLDKIPQYPIPYLIFTAAMCDIGLPCGRDSLSYLTACAVPAPCGSDLRETARLRAIAAGMNESEFERMAQQLAETVRTGRLNFKN